jgi:elongation factor 1-alpha
MIHCHMAQITCEFIDLLEKIDQKTGKTIEKNPEYLKSDDTALVKILPLQQISVEKYVDYPSLGHFIISDQGCILGVGSIKHIEKKNL